ncbi:MAG TPA: hypothetical protein VGL62_06700 [Vicinamibacterales bacterium]|jgi:hypothetical protein
MVEVADVRRRLRGGIEEARRRAAARRALVDETTRAYDAILETMAIPIFRTLAEALTAEAHRFKIETPSGVVRLVRERSSGDHIELALDTQRDVPAVVLRSTHGRGRRTIATEQILAEGPQIADVTDSVLTDAAVQALIPLIER